MRSCSAPAGLLLLAAACSRPAEPPRAAPASRLSEAVGRVARSAACSRTVAMGWVPSLPVPDERGGFKVFFYLPERGAGRAFAASAPRADAAFGLDGRVSSCAPRAAPPGAAGPALNPALAGLGRAEIDRRREDFLARTEEAARVYARRGRLGTKARELLAGFRALREPPFDAEYRRLNPDYWAWLEKEAGS